MKRNTIKTLLLAAVSILFCACVDNVPTVENLPQDAVSFNYRITGDYPLDYYVGSVILFTNTSPESTKGTPTWDFGDGETATGNTAEHFYLVAGTYKVKLTIGEFSKSQVIMISDIKPLLTINPIEGGVCEVNTSKVSFSLEVPNPQNYPLEYLWTMPAGTKNANGDMITTCTDRLPGDLIFTNVGSQSVRLQVKMNGRTLEEGTANVQVGFNQEVPTLYYAVQGGHIMALKLVPDTAKPAGMQIAPFDLGISSGQHPFNLLFKDSSLYVLDCGKIFYYQNDEDKVLGDGKISVISKDGSKVETMLTNAGQYAFDDPFYGYIEDNTLYYANRNTGIITVPLSTRNAIYNASEFPYLVQHNYLGYYNNGWSYGAIGGCLGKINGIWHWTKFYNGYGLFRFQDSDILSSPIAQGDDSNVPKAGLALNGMHPKSFAYDKANDRFFFTVWDEGYGGFYKCTMAELDAIGSTKSNLNPYKILHADGSGFEPNISGSPALIEGTVSEPVAICQLAFDENTGCVYFGFRRAANDATSAPTGLYRYNPETDKIETVIEGPAIYGLVINPTKSKLF